MGQKHKLGASAPITGYSDSEDDSDYFAFSEDSGNGESSSGESDKEESSSGESDSGESFSGDEGSLDTDINDGSDEEFQSGGSESDQAAEESDSSEDEVTPRNTVGDVPLKWYEDEKHIGYDVKGKKLAKKEKLDSLSSYLLKSDDPGDKYKVFDEYNQEEITLTKEERKILLNIVKGKAPHPDFDHHPAYIDWVEPHGKHPLSNAPEPKGRFIPSKWEAKKVVRLIRLIREGKIKFEKPKEKPRFSLLWGDDSISAERRHLSYIHAPKPKLPGHEESYNPSIEYIPTQEEINSYQLMDEEDRPQFIPQRFPSQRIIPGYENAVKESFQRCVDLYLCPRVRIKKLMMDPEALKPKLPSRKDLRPYPTSCYLEYKGHRGAVMSISVESSGQWIASGSTDGTVRIWEVDTGRCLKIWEFDEAVSSVAWNPLPELPILAISVGLDLYLMNTGLGSLEVQKNVTELLHVSTPIASDVSGNEALGLSWIQDDKYGGIRLRHFRTISSVEWHRRGDYFCTLMPADILFFHRFGFFCLTAAILIHRLSTKFTQSLSFKLRGLPVSFAFHPNRSIFFVATKKKVRVYDLVKKNLMKTLESGLREISSIAIHPQGDNVIVGSRDGKLCWFDMDLSTKPYKVLKGHPNDVNKVAFHSSFPLFASCSEDCTAYVFHGMVYSDLNQNPLIVPLEILRGHSSSNGRGVMDCKFHPRQPWLFTAGADSSIRLYCH
ncbi:hypothetical protein M5689_007350 [Euphorbia peplus]|nr:hypothetical protein M5689_007350 [Euphorbia peplus]